MYKKFLRFLLKFLFFRRKEIFGRGNFYQSLPILQILGQRPTDYRIDCYGIEHFITKKTSVLDIGCNVGFFDITIADKVRNVYGIEYNKQLVRIAKIARVGLFIRNVKFVCADFKKWCKSNRQTFDVILSFAVHRWIGMDVDKYCGVLYEMLNDGGTIIFESQNIDNDKSVFYEHLNCFRKYGMEVLKEGIIKDDNVIERFFVILKKRK